MPAARKWRALALAVRLQAAGDIVAVTDVVLSMEIRLVQADQVASLDWEAWGLPARWGGGTHRASALSIVHDLLNGRLSKVIDELDDGRRVINQQETLAAQEKAEALQRRFGEWLWSDADRAKRLSPDDLRALSPLLYSHVNPYGSSTSI